MNTRTSTDAPSDWFQKGVEARIAGRPHTENPLLGPGELPEITGETEALWRKNRDRWWEGWETEDRRRAAQPSMDTERRTR
jgi:hypothetical protein